MADKTTQPRLDVTKVNPTIGISTSDGSARGDTRHRRAQDP
jgi:hypothetical protein